MAKPELQKWVVAKCLKENPAPFEQSGSSFTWAGDTRVKSKQSGLVYPVHVEIHVEADRRTESQLSACLCRVEGVRLEDLQIVHMVSTRLQGKVHISGLPKKDIEVDFNKFVKTIPEGDEA
ncbi:hypothetical protein NZD89_01000 [Alicyclobacillus fastidiosus]|uniref:Uncharacterized protein n=1 Tax=Alicyclobacillus fastidiosus TaxID=392011 RepID=A0ABY6ZH01_9BACL|nr:hypothetical protein [Alicyclobacillus fastidiosus]WAH42129.1 hypothetical protein NZD89_01000 [Alicyclobacillus fastidiosus]GMA63909.1 hypothetical protein GCM10025859_43490 [Alicyclobacillus fastidiosus]